MLLVGVGVKFNEPLDYFLVNGFFLCHPLADVTVYCICFRRYKVKVKFTLEQAMKVQKGSRVIALPFL